MRKESRFGPFNNKEQLKNYSNAYDLNIYIHDNGRKHNRFMAFYKLFLLDAEHNSKQETCSL